MWDGAAQQQRQAPRLWTKTNEIEKSDLRGEDGGGVDRISLEGQTRSLHA
jgi:hypothetical protein